MTLSPYTIDVGPCQPDGTREIYLHHYQRACFSTTHREVMHVCLVKWPRRPCVEEEEAARTADVDETEAIRTQRTEAAYAALLAAGPPACVLDTAAFAECGPGGDAAAQNRPWEDSIQAMEDYLCVFHREELADQYGRYTFVQPQTICTAYRIADTTALELVLHSISPRDIAASTMGGACSSSGNSSSNGGSTGGVFLHGRRQASKGGASWSNPLEFEGLQYKPAADMWWMGSPLSVKPVYVAVSSVASSGGQDTNGSVSRNISFPSAPLTQDVTVSTAEAKTAADECFVASPLHVEDALRRSTSPYSSSPRQGSPLTDATAAAPVAAAAAAEGRTAQGQFNFPRSRSATPPPHSPSQNCMKVGEPHGVLSSSSSRVPLALLSSASPKSKFVTIDATVLAQLPLYDAQTQAPQRSSLAVVRTSSDELGLALTTPLYALDTMLWRWWPHRLRLSRLASSAAALSVVASPHPSMRRQLLFLYDAHYRRLRVLRTPDLFSGDGELELLFAFPCGDLPFVFPCLHTATHPAPIAVCNYPRANWISVYDVATLLETLSADTVALQLDLGAHQAAHTQCFGEIRLLGESSSCLKRSGDAAVVTAGAGSAAAAGDAVGKNSSQDKWSWKSRNAKVWTGSSADAAAPLAHPIRGILYHHDSILVLQYDWPGGAVQTAEAASLCLNSSNDNNANSVSKAAAEGGPDRRRRRCEGTITYTVHFPRLASDSQPLLLLMLDALSAAVGPRAVASVEYRLFGKAWHGDCTRSHAVNPFQACAALLEELCASTTPSRVSSTKTRMLAQSSPVGKEEGVKEAEDKKAAAAAAAAEEAPSRVNRFTPSYAFVDPSMLTLQLVQNALPPLAGDGATSFAGREASGCNNTMAMVAEATPLAWTPPQAGLALVALHLLYEACRLQEPLWKLLPPLAELNHSLSMRMHWPSYVEFYSAMISKPSSMQAENAVAAEATDSERFAQCLSEEVIDEHFERWKTRESDDSSTAAGASAQLCPSASVIASRKAGFAAGEPPDVFRTLSALAMGSSSRASADMSVSHLWPLLKRLPDTHPIALANRLVLVYRDVFGSCVLPPRHKAPAAGADGGAASGETTENAKAEGDGGEPDRQWWERTCVQLLQQHISARFVRQVLNTGVAYPLLEAVTKGREQAEATWPPALLDLVGRRDRCPPTSLAAQLISAGRHVVEAAEENAVAQQIRVALADDGVSVRPDFRKTWPDERLDVAQNIFNTVVPISLSGFEDRPEELTGALELLSSRARAMPLGRGMLTMCTQSFKVQDSIPIPPLNLNGRTNDGICIVNKSTADLMWPLFHNGCAAGLRFLPLPPSFRAGSAGGPADYGDEAGERNTLGQDVCVGGAAGAGAGAEATAQAITKQWVMYQTKNIGNAASRAGLLLATGILGHLTVLQRTDIFYLLISRQEQYVWREATTMAVMLGLSCSFCGTSSEAVFRCLSVHVQSLNPSAEDIEVSLDVQTAALVSMGLLCQRAPSNTFLVEVFLVEISRLPTDEHCSKREGYVLGAGFGLGQLLLGVGAAHGVAHVEDRLLAFMNGAPRKSTVSAREGVEYFEETMGRGEAAHFLARALLSQEQREAIFSTCASVYEGDCYNVFVSGPAAAVALGFMYVRTDHEFIAAKMAPPNRRPAMQRLTPLMCHLRSTMASLIRWSTIAPTRAWLYAQLPSSLLQLTPTPMQVPATTTATTGSVAGLAAQQRSYLLMNLAHCLAGQVMALGLRYAGTMDTEVRDIIFGELQGFLSGQVGSTGAPIPAVQRATGAYETCILTCACALSLVMAGTGDLRVFGVLQHLHRRTSVSYGSHMAVSMSMGLLFLGSGRLTLSNSVASVAALFMAFYPRWPSDAEDNTHHLQALRHLYGLAVVPRVMEAVDAVSRQPVSVPVRIVLRPTKTNTVDNTTAGTTSQAAPKEIRTRTPCLYPPVEMIDRIEINSTHHYPLVFDAFSKELTQSANMEFRVMAREGVSSYGGRHTSRSPLECRLLDWLHRLFHQPSTTAAEALTMMESVRLMHHVQRRRMSTALAGDMLLNSDFSVAVQAAMEKRYSYIFLHRVEDKRSAAQSARAPPHHPLYQLVVEGKPYAQVLASIAAHPHGTAAFPCDFTFFLSAEHQRCRDDVSRTSNNDEEAAKTANEVNDAVDLSVLHRWIVEALHYYGLKRSARQHVRQAFLTLFAAANSATAPAPSSVARFTCLVKLQAETQLPLSTLEKVWACCTC